MLRPTAKPEREHAMGSSTKLHRQRGVSSVLFAVMLPAFLVFVWACVEIGNITTRGTHARSGADGIALAAAGRYWDGREQAVQDAEVVAAASGLSMVVSATGTSGDLQFGDWDAEAQAFTARESGGRAVRAVIQFADGHPNGSLPSVLPGALGPGAAELARAAVAVYCAPRDQTSLLLVGSGPDMLVQMWLTELSMDGLIAVQGDGNAIFVAPSASLRAPAIELAGRRENLSTHENFDADVFEEVVLPADPYAAVALPEPGAPIPVTVSGGVTTIAPGTHAGLVASSGSFVLAPGDHIFTSYISLDGTAALTLDSARIVLVQGARLKVRGGAQVQGTAPPASEGSARMWLASREANKAMLIVNGASVTVDGMLYAPGSDVELNGAVRWESRAAILGSLYMGDVAHAVLSGRIEPLDRAPVPGRARLVK